MAVMVHEEIKDAVRQAYSAITRRRGGARRFYTDEELAEVPTGAVGRSLSVGKPVRHVGSAFDLTTSSSEAESPSSRTGGQIPMLS